MNATSFPTSETTQVKRSKYNHHRFHLPRSLGIILVLSSTSTLFLGETKIFCSATHQEIGVVNRLLASSTMGHLRDLSQTDDIRISRYSTTVLFLSGILQDLPFQPKNEI